MRAWLGIALLSVSWLLGLGYYHLTDWRTWAILVAAGTALLARWSSVETGWKPSAAALLLSLPAVILMRWPYRAAPLLLSVGLMVSLFPRPLRGLRRTAHENRPNGSGEASDRASSRRE